MISLVIPMIEKCDLLIDKLRELYDEYGLELLGYAVDPEDLYLLDPDTDFDTREAISPYCVKDSSGNIFRCGYSRGVLRDADTGDFI